MNTHINEALQDFLTNPHNENKILVIKGKWGVGKTYFWTDFYKTNESLLEQQFPTYSYVSLFGQEAINDVRNTILNNMEIINEKKYKKIISSWKAKKRVLKKLINFIFCNNFLQKYLWSNTKPFSESMYCHHLICFDDIERIDPKFPIEILMGYCDELAQQKNCKIILIFNEDELEEKQRDAFNKYREKIVDVELTYSPTLDEQLRIVFDDKLEKYPIINQVINEQGHINIVIKNIRVLKKINQIIDNFIKITPKDLPPIIMEDFIKRTVYLSYCFYILNNRLPFEIIKNPSILIRQKTSLPDDEEAKIKYDAKLYDHTISIVQYLDINYSSILQKEIIHNLEHGFWSKKNIKSFIFSEIEKIDIITRQSEIRQRIDCAWKLYSSSFKDNLTDIIQIFKNELENSDNYSYWNYQHFIHTINSYYHFKKLQDTTFKPPIKYIDEYIEKNMEQPTQITYENCLHIINNISNIDEVIKNYAIKKLYDIKDQTSKPSLSKFILTLNDRELSYEQQNYLKSLTLSEIKNWLKDIDDPLMLKHIKNLTFWYTSIHNELGIDHNKNHTLISEALQEIADSSPLNRDRIKEFINHNS